MTKKKGLMVPLAPLKNNRVGKVGRREVIINKFIFAPDEAPELKGS